MTKEDQKILFPEHLDRLSKFRRIVMTDVAKRNPEVEISVMDLLDLSKRLRETNPQIRKEDVVLANAYLSMAHGYEVNSAITVDISVLIFSHDVEELVNASDDVNKLADDCGAKPSLNQTEKPLRIEDFHLTPLEEVMTGGLRRIDKGTGLEYEHFKELVYVFTKGDSRRK